MQTSSGSPDFISLIANSLVTDMVFKLGAGGEISIFFTLADARYTWCRLRNLNDDSENCQFEIVRQSSRFCENRREGYF